MGAIFAVKFGYGDEGRGVNKSARLGCWVSPCYGPFSPVGRLETYEKFIFFDFFFGRSEARMLNYRMWWLASICISHT
jgi:hypothetical protein